MLDLYRGVMSAIRKHERIPDFPNTHDLKTRYTDDGIVGDFLNQPRSCCTDGLVVQAFGKMAIQFA